MSLKFYFDEDAAEQALVHALRARGFEVLIPHEVGLLGADDLVQLRWCAEHQYILISHNASDFCRHHRELTIRMIRPRHERAKSNIYTPIIWLQSFTAADRAPSRVVEMSKVERRRESRKSKVERRASNGSRNGLWLSTLDPRPSTPTPSTRGKSKVESRKSNDERRTAPQTAFGSRLSTLDLRRLLQMATFSQSSPRPSSLDVRHRWPVFLLGVPFLASIAFAYCWFNTDIGRSGSRPSTLDSRPRLWLSAKTNIPGYTAHIAA